MTEPQIPVEQLYHLSSFRRSDLDEMIRHLNNPAIVLNLRAIPVPYTHELGHKYYDFLEKEVAANPQRGRLKFIIRDVEEKPVGEISVKREDNQWILGYWLGTEYWGKGIMTWACREALKAARREGVMKVIATPKQGNWSSRKVLEKNGFKYVKDERHYFGTDDKVHEVWVLEINL